MALVLFIVAIVLFRKYGWGKTLFIHPFYRDQTNKYNFDDYSSKGSTVHPVKKFHRNLEAIGATTEHEAAIASGLSDADGPQVGGLDPAGVDVRGDEFWDYGQQVDLESFSAPVLYNTLSKQSREVTQKLGKQKEEVKSLYQKINNQTESLKGLWAAKLNLKGRSCLATPEDLAAYEGKLEELEIELARRRDLGERFETMLSRQQELMDDDEKCREEQQINYESSLSEAIRLLNEHSEKIQRGQVIRDGQFDENLHRSVVGRVGALIQRMSSDVNEECQRLGTWGVLNQGTGGKIVHNDRDPVPKEELIGENMEVLANDLLEHNETTGLIIPKPRTKMLTGDGTVKPIPCNYFLHPQTGNVMAIEGNVAFDSITSRLVFTTDSATGEASQHDEPLIPYVPYPTNKDGAAIKTKLKPLVHRGDMKYGAAVPDPESGIHAPIVAVTIHPETGTVYPIAGTHIDPVTLLPIAIEIGSQMIDPVSRQPVPILAVTLDKKTGDVLPLGGTRSDNNSHTPIIPGDMFIDPIGRKTVKISGGVLTQV
jgi:hypothetical protein